MNNREMTTEELVKQPSILVLATYLPEELKDVSDSSELRLGFARRLGALDTEVSKSRAAFILKLGHK